MQARGPWTPPRPTGRPGAEGCLPNRLPPALGKQSPLPPGPSQGSCNPSAAPGADGLQKNEGGGRKEGGGEGLLWQVMSLQFVPQHVVPVPISPSRRVYFTEKTWPGRPLRCPGGRPEKALLNLQIFCKHSPISTGQSPRGPSRAGARAQAQRGNALLRVKRPGLCLPPVQPPQTCSPPGALCLVMSCDSIYSSPSTEAKVST